MIAGSLPPQNFTYFADLGKDLNFIKESFRSQAKYLNPYVDFFYLDVMSSWKECLLGLSAIKKYKKKILVGIHIRSKGLLPSGEKFITVAKKVQKHKPIGIMASCVSFEDLNEVIKDAKKLKVPFGFKINAFEHIPAGWKPDSNNPKVQLGKRKDLTPTKFAKTCLEFKKMGANIVFRNVKNYKGEKISDIFVKSSSQLKGLNCPIKFNSSAIDEFLIIFLVAAKSKGISYFKRFDVYTSTTGNLLMFSRRF